MQNLNVSYPFNLEILFPNLFNNSVGWYFTTSGCKNITIFNTVEF